MGCDEVLVNCCLHAPQSGGALGDRYAATACQYDGDAAAEQKFRGAAVHDALGEGRGHDPAPSFSVLGEVPVVLLRDEVGLFRGRDRPDELCRVPERRVVAVDDLLGDQRDHRGAQMPGDGLLEPLADQPPGLGDQVAQWVGPGQGSVRGALQRQQANLWAVAVHDHHLVVPGECGKRPGDMRHLVDLRRGAGSLTSPQQGGPARTQPGSRTQWSRSTSPAHPASLPEHPSRLTNHRHDLNIGPTPAHDQCPQWKNRTPTGRSTAPTCKSPTHTKKIRPPESASVDQGSVLPRRDRRCQTERQTRPVFREVIGPANKRRADK